MKKTILLLIIIFAVPVFSQTSASLEGIVLNETSEPVENARIHLLNTSFITFTNSSGEFRFSEIPLGKYLLSIKKGGFAETVQNIQADREIVELEIVLSSEAESLNEVTVTAQKREELIQEIPLSITSLSYQAVEESRIQNANDITAIAPNLYAADPGDRRTVTSIRGIVTTSYDPAIATYIDGVNQFNLDTYITQLFDIERIEVLRGPQGTLSGRNAMGGVINIITKSPENVASAFGEVTVGNYGHQRYLAGIRLPLIKNKLFFGAVTLHEESDGFYQNEFNDTNYDEQKNFSGNYYLTYLINSTWDLKLNFKHFSAKNEGAFPLVIGIDAAFENPYSLNQNQVTTMDDNTYNASLVLEHKGQNLNFSSQTSYQRNYRYYEEALDADFSPLDAVTIFNNYGKDWNNVKVATQEFKFSSPAGTENRLEWTAGTYMFYQESPVKQATQFGQDATLLGLEDVNFSLINTSETTAKGIAFFGQGNYMLTEKLDIIAGLRYDYEQKEQRILVEYQRNEDAQPSFEFQPDTSATANFDALSPKVGLSYKVAEDNLLYFTYSKGFRAGGLTPLSSDPSQPPLFQFEPEFSNNFELGTKNVFLDNRFVLNATLFYMNVNDVQVPTLVLPDAVTLIRNTGKLTSKGVEIEARALLTKGLELSYDFGFTDAEYASFNLAVDGGEIDLENKKQIFTPNVTSLLALQYKSKLGINDDFQFFVRGEWKYLGEQYFDLANTLQQDPYSLFNANVGFSWKELKATFWSRNILDQRYISYGYNFGAVHLGNPATYGISLSFRI